MANADTTAAPETHRNDLDQADKAEAINSIRSALLIGLASYGEIERLSDQAGIITACGKELPDGMRPIHPTGSADTVSNFAEALSLLETLQH